MRGVDRQLADGRDEQVVQSYPKSAPTPVASLTIRLSLGSNSRRSSERAFYTSGSPKDVSTYSHRHSQWELHIGSSCPLAISDTRPCSWCKLLLMHTQATTLNTCWQRRSQLRTFTQLSLTHPVRSLVCNLNTYWIQCKLCILS